MLGFCDQVVVVDGGSIDGTWERLEEMSVDDDTSQWFFMDDITNWNLDELPLDQIVWEDQE